MRFLSLLFCTVISVNTYSQITERVHGFMSGTEGHKSYRIPAIIRAPGGDLLVVDLSDPAYPQGRIFLFYNTGNNHKNEVRKGNGLREVWYKTSSDRGFTPLKVRHVIGSKFEQ